MKQISLFKRKVAFRGHDSHEAIIESSSVVEGNVKLDKNRVFKEESSKTKVAKEIHKVKKV